MTVHYVVKSIAFGLQLTSTRARGFELLSRFLARDPHYLLKDPAQLPRLFDVLSEENPTELKLSAANCLRRLAITFQDAQRQNHPALRSQLGKLERLLYENMEKPGPLCRLVAVNFASLIYPSDHIPTRYLILQALGDKDQHVRKEACMAFEQFLDPNIIHDIVYGRVKLPSFVEFVNHDTQHSRKNPFVEVERLIPVVQFIRLCLLATRGGLTAAQEAGLTYETEDEVRYLVNQTVRYFLAAGSNTSTSATNTSSSISTTSPNASAGTSSSVNAIPPINPEQAKRSIDTYFRLIQVVIFTRSQHTKDSPNFPNYLEEVLVGNTKELITCNKQLFDRMNSVLLATPKGANCRHACASVYSVVVMETETPNQALQTAKNMLSALPTPGSHIDGEASHAVQGMFMGAAYLLERLFTRHVTLQGTSGQTSTGSDQTTSSVAGKKSKKEKQQQQNQQQQQKQLRADIIATIEHLVNLMSSFLVKPNCLFYNPTTTVSKDKRAADGGCYVNANVAQVTVAALLEALMILARAGCLSHLPAGSLPISGNTTSLIASKAAMVHRIASYLPSAATYGGGGELTGALSGQLHVAQAALRALAACCMGEGTEVVADLTSGKVLSSAKTADSSLWVTHPHTTAILKLMTDTAEINDPSLHLAVGISLADCLLGPASPLKHHWYERVYPLVVPPDAIQTALSSPAGVWLANRLSSLLTHRPGQVQVRPATLAAAFWALALVRRIGPLPNTFLPDRLIIDLLEENDESVQCVAVATLGQIYDRSSEDARIELVTNLTKTIAGNDKRQSSPIYRELCSLAQQIGRPDLALSLIVLAIAPPPPNARFSNCGNTTTVGCTLASSITNAGLVRRLGRSLAPALPRLVPRIFVRRFDYARTKLRQAIENVWIGLVSYASSSAAPPLTCVPTCSNLSLPGLCDEYSSLSAGSTNAPELSSYVNTVGITPPEEAAIAVQKLVIRVLENPCSREAAAGLLPGLLPVIIDRAPWTLGSVGDVDPLKADARGPQLPSESRRLALELLLAAARTARPSALRPALPQLVLAGLHTMSMVHPSLVASLMRQPIHHLHQLHASTLPQPKQQSSSTAGGVAISSVSATGTQPPSHVSVTTNNKEIQMAEVLRLCVRLIDDVCLSRLIVPFTELIRAGGASPTANIAATGNSRDTRIREAASTATATCVFLSHLAAANASAMAASATLSRGNTTCLRCSSSAVCGAPMMNGSEHMAVADSPNGSPSHRLHPSPSVSAQSSPSAMCGLSPPTPPTPNLLDSTSPSDLNVPSHRCRASAGSQKSTLSIPAASTLLGSTGSGCPILNTTSSAGGGFASLVPHTGKLLAALLSALPGACRHPESAGKTVQIEMACTLASLLRFAKDTSVAKLFNRVRSWYLNPEAISGTNEAVSPTISHWACARVMHAVARHCPELLYAHAGITLPLIFLNRQPEPEGAGTTYATIDYTVTHQNTLSIHDRTSDVIELDGNSKGKRPSVVTGEQSDEFEALRPLWQETWEELLAKSPTSSYPAQLLWPCNGGTGAKFFAPACALLTSFLRSPMLEHCIQLIREALLECPSWSVRTQAASAVLHLAARLIGQPAVPSHLATAHSRPNRTSSKIVRTLVQRPFPPGSDGTDLPTTAGGEPIVCREQHVTDCTQLTEHCSASDKEEEEEEEEEEEASEDEDVDEEGEEVAHAEKEWVAQAWIALVHITAEGLTRSKPWPGKTCLLRAARLLAVHARERELATDPVNLEPVHQLWCALVRETRAKRAESIGAGYRAEAFLSLASFAEASGKDAVLSEEVATESVPNEADSEDRLSSLFRLIVPHWTGREKRTDQGKALTVNSELSDSELELAVRALGILWPMRQTSGHLPRFAEAMRLLNFVLTQGSRRVQAASLASFLGIMAKLTPEQSAQLVSTVENSTGSSRPAVELGLNDLLIRIKRCAESPKSQLLREHALGSVATLLRHPSFSGICREEVVQILNVFCSDGAPNLRDCAANLLKNL
ncbi:uncharacterized protein DEA37_0006852 [Paragonimus westermani]|uniref:Proteasome component Ecm29 N-terminal domain-containing protein n=1 Tax=Paragonimus westermani TaxID=34504 RepID=A0A5J4NQN4_9TREM|nr:uncharacterized protein DEA37_0006852 [Paragonimus westermani]